MSSLKKEIISLATKLPMLKIPFKIFLKISPMPLNKFNKCAKFLKSRI